jgi:integrase
MQEEGQGHVSGRLHVSGTFWGTDGFEQLSSSHTAQIARELELPKLTFQVIRRTIATLGKTKGHVKDIQGMMRHSKASTTTDVYMQSLDQKCVPPSTRSTQS